MDVADEVLKAVSPAQENDVDVRKTRATLDQHDSIVQNYKKLIQEQVGLAH